MRYLQQMDSERGWAEDGESPCFWTTSARVSTTEHALDGSVVNGSGLDRGCGEANRRTARRKAFNLDASLIQGRPNATILAVSGTARICQSHH
jgi:hypothetical protein